jgi:hypothetical protein
MPDKPGIVMSRTTTSGFTFSTRAMPERASPGLEPAGMQMVGDGAEAAAADDLVAAPRRTSA